MKDMTQAERFDYILKLEADNREQRLQHDLAKAKYEAKQRALNIGVSAIIMYTNIVTMAALGLGEE